VQKNSTPVLANLLRLYRAALDACFPPRCPGCGKSGAVWCEICDGQLHRLATRGCPDCGLPHRASDCPGERLRVRSFASYRPPLTRAILELKYRPNRALGQVMAGWLAGFYRALGWQAELVLAVPLAVARRRQRGYNQVELISSPLAEALDLPHYRNALIRVRDTGSQVGHDFLARRVNVQGAFSADPRLCNQRSILLIDDLVTTGATILACSQALYDAGAAGVYALTVGRAAGMS